MTFYLYWYLFTRGVFGCPAAFIAANELSTPQSIIVFLVVLFPFFFEFLFILVNVTALMGVDWKELG